MKCRQFAPSFLFAFFLLAIGPTPGFSQSAPGRTATNRKAAVAKKPHVYRCEGFADPFQKGSVQVNRGRTLPLRANLLDKKNVLVGPSALKAPPLIEVLFEPKSGKPIDSTDSAEARDFGQGAQFVFKEDYWKFDLGTDGLSESGTYRVRLISGDEKAYRIEPTCSLTFLLR